MAHSMQLFNIPYPNSVLEYVHEHVSLCGNEGKPHLKLSQAGLKGALSCKEGTFHIRILSPAFNERKEDPFLTQQQCTNHHLQPVRNHCNSNSSSVNFCSKQPPPISLKPKDKRLSICFFGSACGSL